jgi:alkane 1-monooxygenase
MKLAWWTQKKLGYLLFLLPPLLPLLAYGIGRVSGYWNLSAFLTPFVLFFCIPTLDLVIGRDAVNATPEEEQTLRNDATYTWMLIACLPAQLCALAFGAWVVRDAPLTWVGKAVWIVSQGMISSIIAINTGHELVHRTKRSLRLTGGTLLATVGYATFMVEHTLGHHVHVATEVDPSSAKRGDNAYRFTLFAIAHNIQRGFSIERNKLKRTASNHGIFAGSELIPLYGFTVLLCALGVWFAGGLGLLFVVGQSLVAIAMLEVINFVEHYGLSRERLPSGRGYVTTTPMHSWNSNFLLTNLVLFQLQRHSDHHANAARPYQMLRHMPNSPQLPFGYPTMIILALVPPLFRAVVHPLLDAQAREAAGEFGRENEGRTIWTLPAGWVPERAYTLVASTSTFVASTRRAVTGRLNEYVKFLQ